MQFGMCCCFNIHLHLVCTCLAHEHTILQPDVVYSSYTHTLVHTHALRSVNKNAISICLPVYRPKFNRHLQILHHTLLFVECASVCLCNNQSNENDCLFVHAIFVWIQFRVYFSLTSPPLLYHSLALVTITPALCSTSAIPYKRDGRDFHPPLARQFVWDIFLLMRRMCSLTKDWLIAAPTRPSSARIAMAIVNANRKLVFRKKIESSFRHIRGFRQ